MNDRHIWKIVFLGMIAAIPMWACTQGPAAEPEEKPVAAKPVRVAVLGRADMADVLRYAADLLPHTEVNQPQTPGSTTDHSLPSQWTTRPPLPTAHASLELLHQTPYRWCSSPAATVVHSLPSQ